MEEKKLIKKKSNINWKRVGNQAAVAFLNGAISALGAIVIARIANSSTDTQSAMSSKVTPISKIG
ncbi:hypothetical protein EP01_09545 [Bdellovibrio bacteriovorus]|uniref:hypothetical protein n=1 Tax=Bdellovibrio bacteriovorus TaxID=959 RepID=UPI00045C14A4|nr:hypothetical protein [Bdellovibrio bacteriovorus]AHZ85179.1 hypothetical protein EP01_09545 [Bdellovibrio bacteriovorus]